MSNAPSQNSVQTTSKSSSVKPSLASTLTAQNPNTSILQGIEGIQKELKYSNARNLTIQRAAEQSKRATLYLARSTQSHNTILKVLFGLTMGLLVLFVFNIYMKYKYLIDGLNQVNFDGDFQASGWRVAIGLELPFFANAMVTGGITTCEAFYLSFYSADYWKYFKADIIGHCRMIANFIVNFNTNNSYGAQQVICKSWGCICGLTECQQKCPPKPKNKYWWAGAITSVVTSFAMTAVMPGIGTAAAVGVGLTSGGAAVVSHFASNTGDKCNDIVKRTIPAQQCNNTGSSSCRG